MHTIFDKDGAPYAVALGGWTKRRLCIPYMLVISWKRAPCLMWPVARYQRCWCGRDGIDVGSRGALPIDRMRARKALRPSHVRGVAGRASWASPGIDLSA